VILVVAIGAVSESLSEDPALLSFDSDRAFGDARVIMGGPRLTGAHSEQMAVAYIEREISDTGFQVTVERYPEILFEVEYTRLELVAYLDNIDLPDARKEVIPLDHLSDYAFHGYSPSLSWEGIDDDLEVVDVGDGSEDGRWDDVAGKVVIADDWPIGSRTIYDKATNGGAAAVFLVNSNNRYSGLPYSGGGLSPIYSQGTTTAPFLSLSGTAGDNLRAMALQGYRVRLDCDITIESRFIHVMVAEKRGTTHPEEVLMIGAHHDSVYNSVGAVDNGAGTVSIIELARQFSSVDTGRTIRLATFGGEEQGIFGSYRYFEAHEDELVDEVTFYVNLDMPDINPERTGHANFLIANSSTIPVVAGIWEEVKEERPELAAFYVTPILYDLQAVNSDQQVFARHGIPTGYSAGGGMRYKHTYLDTIEEVTPLSWEISGRVWGTYLLRMANE